MLVRVDNGNDPADRFHKCEFCGSLYRCRKCRIEQRPDGQFTMVRDRDCAEEYRCPECAKPEASTSILTAEERRLLEEL